MKKLKLFLLFTLLFIVSCSSQQNDEKNASAAMKDDLGVEVQIDKVPQKVMTLAPNLTEMIYALGVEDHLVGNTLFCDYPPAAQKITKVGDMLTFDYEQILKIKPDLIFATIEGNKKDTYEKLTGLGFKVFISNPRDYEGIKRTFMDMGKIFDKENTAKDIIAGWDSSYAAVKNGAKKLQPQSVMVMIALNPLMVAAKTTFIEGYLDACNMNNFVESSNQNYPVFSREVILEKNPDIIVYPSDGSDDVNTILEVYPEWKNLPAIKNNKVLFVDRDLYFRPGPRFITALEDFYSKLQNNL